MKTICKMCSVAALVLGGGVAAAADPLENLRYALSGGTPNLDLRLRYESVDQESPTLANANALTVRTRLGYTTGKWNLLDAAAEYEGVEVLGDALYDNNPAAAIGTPGYSVISDPRGSELNQAWLRYTGLPGTVVKLGRQRIIFDNARFIGNVGWRQNEMTYDGYLVTNTSIAKTTINLAHITNANNIFFNDFRVHGNLLNVAYAHNAWLKAVAYGYLLDFTPDVPVVANRQDTLTYGLRFTGEGKVGPGKLGYAAEYAQQDDNEEATLPIDVDYKLAELSYGIVPATIKAGFEVLGSKGGLYGFQTPLATMHAHDGWADMFLNTPATGLQNTYVGVNGVIAQQYTWTLRAHQWKSAYGSADYGNEIDALLAYAVNDAFSVTAKYADFDGKTNAAPFPALPDTKKAWLMAEYKF